MGLVNVVVPPENLEEEIDNWCKELINRGPQALYAVKASFAARHGGVSGFSRVAHDLLLTYYLESQESKELMRSFSEKTAPNQEKFYK
jgi:naphthoate synthase